MRLIHKYIGLVCASILFFTSCESDVLDNNPYYMGDSADQIFSDPVKIAAASVGLYDALQNSEFLGGRAQIYVDARGIDLNPPTYFGNLSTFQPTSSDATIEDAWQGAYRTIYECNLFLKGIEGAKAASVITESEYKTYSAEAKFIRGVVYFYTLNFWGQMYAKESENLGVPLVLQAFDGGSAFTEAIKITRSTIDDCYKQIISDFEYAEQNLSDTRDDVYEGRATATSSAAQAMLCRTYLYMKDNAKAIAYANKLDGKYSLESTTITNLTNPAASSEVIFFIAMNISDNPNTNNALGQHYGKDARADITVNSDYLNLFSNTDKRKTDVVVQKGGNWYCNKYQNGTKDWAPIIRYAEILLNKAEALVKSSNTVDAGAVSLLNQVHGRSDSGVTYSTSDFANAQALLDEILKERRRELAFEGHGSFDLFRNGKGIPAGRGSASAPALEYPNNYFALPIPNSDIEKAGANVLKQNKGY